MKKVIIGLMLLLVVSACKKESGFATLTISCYKTGATQYSYDYGIDGKKYGATFSNRQGHITIINNYEYKVGDKLKAWVEAPDDSYTVSFNIQRNDKSWAVGATKGGYVKVTGRWN